MQYRHCAVIKFLQELVWCNQSGRLFSSFKIFDVSIGKLDPGLLLTSFWFLHFSFVFFYVPLCVFIWHNRRVESLIILMKYDSENESHEGKKWEVEPNPIYMYILSLQRSCSMQILQRRNHLRWHLGATLLRYEDNDMWSRRLWAPNRFKIHSFNWIKLRCTVKNNYRKLLMNDGVSFTLEIGQSPMTARTRDEQQRHHFVHAINQTTSSMLAGGVPFEI